MIQSEISKSRSILNYENAPAFEDSLAITEEIVLENLLVIQEWIDFFISYPDLFLDMILPKDSQFEFYYFQRKFLRANTRYKYFFGTYTRAYSKSFLSILIQIVKCILQPGTNCFICTNTKSTAVKISIQKMNEIFQIWPLLKTEVLAETGTETSEKYKVAFKNGSTFQVIPISDASRGLRMTSGIMEEAALVDGEDLADIIIPTMNISRRDIMGKTYEDDPMNQAQCFITTASSKSSYAYERLIEMLIMSIISPESAYICGGDYRLPVSYGLIAANTIRDVRLSDTYKPESFAREYLSIWNGSHASTWINIDRLAKHRTMLYAEREARYTKLSPDSYYVISVDVGRSEANTAIHIFKIFPQANHFQKKLVFTDAMSDMRFNQQAAAIKNYYKKYLPKYVVIDGTGVGIGLCDFLTIGTYDLETGEYQPPLGIHKADDYKDMKAMEPDAPKVLWIIKANAGFNSEMHSNCYSELSSGHVDFLCNEREIRSRLLATVKGPKMSLKKKMIYLRPYEQTTRLFDEIGNLKIKQNNTGKIEVEKISGHILKDRWSALELGLWVIKQDEIIYYKRKSRSKLKAKDYLMFN